MGRSSMRMRVRVYAVSLVVLTAAIGFAGVVRGSAPATAEEVVVRPQAGVTNLDVEA